MKRVLSLILCAAVLLACSGCKSDPEKQAASWVTTPTTSPSNTPADGDIPDIIALAHRGSSVVYTMNEQGEWEEFRSLSDDHTTFGIDAVPLALQNAVIAAADKNFFTHNGEDGETVTISQRVLKLTSTASDAASLKALAVKMEAERFSKQDILEAYLNLMPFSSDAYGVGDAAKLYFASSLESLTTAQCALIAAIGTSDTACDPFADPDGAKVLQTTVLQNMKALGFLNDTELAEALAEELSYESASASVEVFDYYTDLLIEDVIDDLQATYGYTYEAAEQLVMNGGLRIYSYENVETQQAVEAIFEDDSNFPDRSGSYSQPTAAVFIMDYEGRVVATVGDRGEKTENRVKNIGTDVRRRPGSTIKPLGVFAPALDQDLINYSTLVANRPIDLGGGNLWPHNFQETIAQATGWRTVQYALQVSLNTVPVQILTKLGARTSYNFMTDTLHFTSLTENDCNYAALALGGFEYGVTVREMTAGYQIFGNGGVYNKPHTYALVTDAAGEELLKHTPEKEQAISPETATIMNKMLQKVVTQGTASAIYGDLDMEVFGKTGTTDYNIDSYFCGGTPYYVGSLWLGYENSSSMTEGQRVVQKEIWSKCMQAVHNVNGKTSGAFDMWGNVEGHYYDGSGNVSEYGSSYGYYKATNVPYSNNTLGYYTPSGSTTTTTTTTTTTAPSTEETESTESTEPTGSTEPTTPSTDPTTEVTSPTTTTPTTTTTTTAPVTTTTGAPPVTDPTSP